MTSRASKPRRLQLSVREAKDRFSELVRRAAKGEEIFITSHGEVRARLGPARRRSMPLVVDRKWLREMKVGEHQSPSETLIRSDRDQRD
ncbi:MAG: type II toxin-antitoxin system Phd/YefM family antitoxin [Vicinamibacteria bacterium]